MKNSHESFDKDHALHQLKHYLPTQAPLKDFIHHNTLHAFQDKFFHTGLAEAAQIFGYKVYLSLEEYQASDALVLCRNHSSASASTLWCTLIYSRIFLGPYVKTYQKTAKLSC